jgi:hypothetical protein
MPYFRGALASETEQIFQRINKDRFFSNMSFNTFVLTDGKQNFFNSIKSQMETTITNMYHNLDPSIKKMKHKDIAKHLRDKFLETEPAFFSTEPRKNSTTGQGIVVSNAMLFAIILYILRLLAGPAEAASRSRSTVMPLLLTNGDDMGDGDVMGDVEVYGDNSHQTFGQVMAIQKNELQKQYIEINVPKILISFKELVGTMLETFRIPKILNNLGMDLQDMSDTYMNDSIIPGIRQSWIDKIESIGITDSYNKVKGFDQKHANDVMLISFVIQQALLFDEDFHENIYKGKYKDALKRAKSFTRVNIKRYKIEAIGSDRSKENDTVCRSIVNRLKNVDQRLRWQEGFQLSSSGVPIDKVLESATWGEITELQNKWEKKGTNSKAILKEAKIGVWSVVTQHIAYKMETDTKFLSKKQRNQLLNKVKSSAQGITTVESVIQKEAIDYLDNQTGEDDSVKQIAINAVMRKINDGEMVPILDTLNVQVEGFKQVIQDEQNKNKRDRLQGTIDNLLPTSSFSFMLGLFRSMSVSTVAALLLGTAVASSISYVGFLVRKVIWNILKFPLVIMGKVGGMVKDKIGVTPTDYSGLNVKDLKK